jgi:hypothetical protein
MPPSMCRGGATHRGDTVDTAQIAISSSCGSSRTVVSESAVLMTHTPTCRMLPPLLAHGGLPDAIHPVPNRLMYNTALPTLCRSVGNRLRLSWPMSRLTSPDVETKPPAVTSGNVSLIRFSKYRRQIYAANICGKYRRQM